VAAVEGLVVAGGFDQGLLLGLVGVVLRAFVFPFRLALDPAVVEIYVRV